eukprot:1330249-Amorphochlora_amoeboformis.AAC.1
MLSAVFKTFPTLRYSNIWIRIGAEREEVRERASDRERKRKERERERERERKREKDTAGE